MGKTFKVKREVLVGAAGNGINSVNELKGVQTTKEIVMSNINKRDKPMGIGTLANMLLEAGYSAEDTLAKVKQAFPGGATTMNCIYYYASKNPKVSLSRAKSTADEKGLASVLGELRKRA